MTSVYNPAVDESIDPAFDRGLPNQWTVGHMGVDHMFVCLCMCVGWSVIVQINKSKNDCKTRQEIECILICCNCQQIWGQLQHLTSSFQNNIVNDMSCFHL